MSLIKLKQTVQTNIHICLYNTFSLLHFIKSLYIIFLVYCNCFTMHFTCKYVSFSYLVYLGCYYCEFA